MSSPGIMRNVLFLLLICAAASCVKTKEEPVSPATNYYFQNNTGKHIIIRVADDSDWTSKPTYLEADAGGRVAIPYNELVKKGNNRKLSYYWATSDFSASNWHKAPWPEMDYNAAQPEYRADINMDGNRNDIAYCLQGIDGSTYWKAVDAFDATGKSVWATLSSRDKIHEFELQFSKAGIYTHANKFGVTTKDYFFYQLNSNDNTFKLTSTFYQTVDTAQKNDHIQMVSNGGSLFKAQTHSTDSLFLVPAGKLPYYLMVKE